MIRPKISALVPMRHNSERVKAKTLFATHYHVLNKLSEKHNNIKNYNIAVKETDNEIVFLHKIISGGTDNHLVLVSFVGTEISGKDADAALGNAGITINKNTVPGETRSPFVTSGIRVGSPALTSRGMKEKEFELIANKMADVLDDINNTELQASIKEELKALAQNFVIYNQSTY